MTSKMVLALNTTGIQVFEDWHLLIQDWHLLKSFWFKEKQNGADPKGCRGGQCGHREMDHCPDQSSDSYQDQTFSSLP